MSVYLINVLRRKKTLITAELMKNTKKKASKNDKNLKSKSKSSETFKLGVKINFFYSFVNTYVDFDFRFLSFFDAFFRVFH